MKKILIAAIFAIFLVITNNAHANCLLIKEGDTTIKQEGDCTTRRSPASTFKIALSLIGFDSGILVDGHKPNLPFKKGYVNWLERWEQPHDPELWIKNSCLWYSRFIAKELGFQKLQAYLHKLDYGNKDISGEKWKNNALTDSWIGSSLEISPEEQMTFIQKLMNNKLPVSQKAHQMTKNILFAEELEDGWKMYGKTGMCNQRNADRTKQLELQTGWYTGWIEKDDRHIAFVNYYFDTEKHDTHASSRAKEDIIKRLNDMIASGL